MNIENRTFLPKEDIAHPANIPAASVAELTRFACVKPPGIDRVAFASSPSTSVVSGYIISTKGGPKQCRILPWTLHAFPSAS